MKIAIIGGGASGMIAAYLLTGRHQLTVFEKQPILGGNIRTINKNVSGVAVDKDIKLDNGVIEFEETRFVYFHRLMGQLKVELSPVPGTTGFFLEDKRYFLSPYAIHKNASDRWYRWLKYLQSLPLAWQWHRFHRKTQKISEDSLYQYSIGDFLGKKQAHNWMRMLIMYCYSIPYRYIDDVPAVLGVPIGRDYWRTAKWNRIKGGVYTYIEKILEQFDGRIILNARITSIRRATSKVVIKLADGSVLEFDKLIFATPPDQVLQLLADPTEAERKRFSAWKGNRAQTVIHSDLSIYKPYGVRYFSEFDVFEKEGGKDAGYNAYLNRLSGLPAAHPVAYNLAFNMEDRIAPEKILHIQEHITPFYTRKAMQYGRRWKPRTARTILFLPVPGWAMGYTKEQLLRHWRFPDC